MLPSSSAGCPLTETTYPQLKNPPLREALIDIRLSEALPVEWVNKLNTLTFETFAGGQPIKESSVKFEVTADKPAMAAVTSDLVVGRRYDAADGAQVIQVRRNGMTLSILKNYTNWDVLRTVAQACWRSFQEISGPVRVTRLAVRYLNAIEIPLGADYDQYITAGPRIPSDLPQIVNNFIQRVEIPFEAERAVAIVTQSLAVPAGSYGPTILDIDAFTECSLTGESHEIWTKLGQLRLVANRIFFSSVTETVLKSYL